MNGYICVIRKYTKFSDKVHQKEYLICFLFNFSVSIALGFIIGFIGGIFEIELIITVSLIDSCIILSIAVTIRRIHDVYRRGWRFPLSVVNFIFLCMNSHSSKNEYGVNPKRL